LPIAGTQEMLAKRVNQQQQKNELEPDLQKDGSCRAIYGIYVLVWLF
jgi:hypothetical protein